MSLKLKWALIVGGFFILAGAALVVGFQLAGWDVLAWFTTKWAFIVYFFVGLYAVLIGSILIHDYAFRK